jgi:hypothetical protein
MFNFLIPLEQQIADPFYKFPSTPPAKEKKGEESTPAKVENPSKGYTF